MLKAAVRRAKDRRNVHFVALRADWEAKWGGCQNTSESAGAENEASIEEKGNKFSLHLG